MGDIVVVIPALNVANCLPRQLSALDDQTDLNFRVVVSDNGSTDRTRALVEQWQPRFEGLAVVDSSIRRGAASARNIGVSASSEPLILFCDADDRVHPGWVAAMRTALTKASAVTGPLLIMRPGDSEPEDIWNQSGAPVSMGYLPYMPSCNMGVTRAVFDCVRGFDETLVRGQEDVDFGWRVSQAGVQIAHSAEAVIDYMQRAGLRSYLLQQIQYGGAHVALFQRHQKASIPTASWRTSARWFIEWLKQFPAAVRKHEARSALGAAAFQAARCYASFRARTNTPL